MKKILVIIFNVIIINIKAQEKERIEIEVVVPPLNYYKKNYRVCNDENNLELSNYEDINNNVVSTNHTDFNITTIPLIFGNNKLTREEIKKKQLDCFTNIIVDYHSDIQNTHNLKYNYTHICKRNALVLDFNERKKSTYFNKDGSHYEKEQTTYFKHLYFMDKGTFSGQDILYKVIILSITKSGLEVNYKKLIKCLNLNNNSAFFVDKYRN